MSKFFPYNEIKSIYDPAEKITEFNIKMINYYYWFGCIAYCDDKHIKEKKKCCPEILNDWITVFHKEYYMDIDQFLLLLNDYIENSKYKIDILTRFKAYIYILNLHIIY